MCFYGAAQLASIVFQLPPGSIEGLANRLGKLFLLLAIGNQLHAGQSQPDAHNERSALTMVRDGGCLYRDLAADYPLIISFKRGCFFPDLRFERCGKSEVT